MRALCLSLRPDELAWCITQRIGTSSTLKKKKSIEHPLSSAQSAGRGEREEGGGKSLHNPNAMQKRRKNKTKRGQPPVAVIPADYTRVQQPSRVSSIYPHPCFSRLVSNFFPFSSPPSPFCAGLSKRKSSSCAWTRNGGSSS